MFLPNEQFTIVKIMSPYGIYIPVTGICDTWHDKGESKF